MATRTQSPFECKLCGKMFSYESPPEKHKQISHLDKSPFKCKVGGNKFKGESDLEKHILDNHNNKNPYVCYHVEISEGVAEEHLYYDHRPKSLSNVKHALRISVTKVTHKNTKRIIT